MVTAASPHHRSLTTCHLAGIAARLGRKIRWDPEHERILGDNEAQRFVSRHTFADGSEIGRNVFESLLPHAFGDQGFHGLNSLHQFLPSESKVLRAGKSGCFARVWGRPSEVA